MRWAAMLLIGGFAASPGSARAAALTPLRLVYQRDPGAEACPDEAQLRDAVAARLGYDPFTGQGQRAVEITIHTQGDGLEARVTMVGPTGTPAGTRVLHSSSPACHDLAAAVTLAVILLLDPLSPGLGASAALPATTDGAPGSPQNDDKAATLSAAVAPTTAPPGSGPSFEVSLAVLGAVGAVSSPDLGFALQAGLAWTAISLGIEGRVNLPAQEDLSTGSITTSQLTGSLVPCLTRWHLGLCLLVSAGATRVVASGVTPAGSQLAPFVGLGGRVFGGLPLADWLDARLQVDLLGQVTHTSIVLGDSTVWSSSPVSGSFAIALAARFR